LGLEQTNRSWDGGFCAGAWGKMEIDADVFWSRVKNIKHEWSSQKKVEGSVWEGVDAVCSTVGKPNKTDSVYFSESLHRYLFGVLMTNTIILMTEDKLTILSTAKKIELLKPVAAKYPDGSKTVGKLELLQFAKENMDQSFDNLISLIKTSGDGKRLSTLVKEGANGKFAEEWKSKLEGSGLDLVDLNAGLQSVLISKDEAEIKAIRKSALLVNRCLKKVFIKRMEDIFENDEKKSHKDMAQLLSDKLSNPAKMKVKLDSDDVELSMPPLVQSGGKYNLTIGTESDERNLSSDVMTCQLGVVYKEYHSLITRTFFVNPTSEQEKTYKLLVKAFSLLQKKLVPGAELGAVYDEVTGLVEKENPELRKCMGRTLGWGTGLDVRFPAFAIRSGNKRRVVDNMAFMIQVTFNNVALSDSDKAAHPTIEGGKYSCSIANTVLATGGGCEALTDAKFDFDDIHYNFKDSSEEEEDDDEEEEEDEDAAEAKRLNALVNGKKTRVTRSQNKSKEQLEREKEAASLEARMAKAQDDLMKKKARNATSENKDMDVDKDEEEESAENVKLLNVYKNTQKYPRELHRNQIYCDKDNETVFVPVGGFHVPFHISTIKVVSKIDEERATLLRLNFYYPTTGHTFARDVPKSMRAVMTQLPNFNYVKEMSFRSKNAANLNAQFRAIKEMQKRVRARQKQIEQEADLVDQVDLVVSRDNRQRLPTLDDVSMRPTLKKGKCIGRVQAHQNGLRFRTNRGEIFDLIYSNVKHFFFQECKKELTVLIHFHLKHPVMVGRTKTYDVQFYTEVVEGSAALDQKKRNMHDPDEEEEERRERMLKKRLNKIFRNFCKELCDNADRNNQQIGVDSPNDFDVPFRKMAFQGVPNKEMVWLIPTVHCLVNLTETPFFVIALDDIEHIHFERVNNHTKNFDMVVILKTQMQPNSSVPQRITSIPIQSLETIRKWLYDKGDITFTAGSSALNWKNVMEGVYQEIEDGIFWENKDLDGEKKDLGWNFLKLEDEEEDEEEGSESDFSEGGGSSEASESSDNWDDDVDESSDDDDSDEEDDESGADWDELEKEAAASDARKKQTRHAWRRT